MTLERAGEEPRSPHDGRLAVQRLLHASPLADMVHARVVLEPPLHSRIDARFPLRRALVEDAGVIAAFHTMCWRAAYTGLVPQEYLDRTGVAEREPRWRERISTGSRVVALGEDGGCVVGVVSWGMTRVTDAPALELASLYVGPAHQSVGVAGQLLRHAIGEEPAHLWVFEANHRARRFYETHGFTADGRQATDADTGLPELLYVRS